LPGLGGFGCGLDRVAGLADRLKVVGLVVVASEDVVDGGRAVGASGVAELASVPVAGEHDASA
jgi:hypothetical protein